MKVNVDTRLENFLGAKPDGKDYPSLKEAIVNSLMAPTAKTGEEKVTLFDLAERVHVGGNVDLSSEDIDLIKDHIGRMYGPVIVGPAFRILSE